MNDKIAFNIMDIKEAKQIWDKFKSIFIKVGQGVVFSIL